MPFAIMTRDLDSRSGRTPRLLAVDIPCPVEARGMVERIAATYPDCGRTRFGWSFRDRDGLHEIWAAPYPG